MAGMKGGTKLNKTRKYGRRTFRLERSYRMKSGANKAADNLRERGKTARVAKVGKLWRVFVGPQDRR